MLMWCIAMMGACDGVEEVQVGGFVSSDKPAVAAGAQEGPTAGEREGDPQHGTGGTAMERDGARAEAAADLKEGGLGDGMRTRSQRKVASA
jgi:hypothetical protein